MIIFDLDGTLADCEHRRHFVDEYNYDQSEKGYIQEKTCNCEWFHASDPWVHKETGKKWKQDWKAFYDACDKDEPIESTIDVFITLLFDCFETDRFIPRTIEIWSGRCESVRNKTENWLCEHGLEYSALKMRPIGDSTPDDKLKESWLDEALSQGKKIDFVFDDRPKVVCMWRRRGIFVFNCLQSDGDF